MIPRSDTTVIDGQFVSEKHSQVVQAIKEYDANLEVQWAPPHMREPGQAAFRVMYNPTDGTMPYVLFHVKTEEEFDYRVLQRIIMNDQRNGAHTLDEFEAAERAREAVAKQKWLDELEAQHDLAAHILKTHKNTYRVNKDLVIKDGIPFNAAHL